MNDITNLTSQALTALLANAKTTEVIDARTDATDSVTSPTLKDRLDKHSNQIGISLGTNIRSIQTTFTKGNLTQVKELDANSAIVTQSDLTYNPDGTVNTITETINGKRYTTTLNYVNGDLDPVNPFTRSVV